MKRLQQAMIAAFASLALATSAHATIIYDNGAPTTTESNETTQWVQAEDFSFASGATVGGAGVYLAGLGSIDAWDGNFTYFIFSANGGQPGSVLQSGDVSITPSDSGLPTCCGGNAFLFEFDFLTPFDAAAGATYWLGIHASEDFVRDQIFWVSAAPNGTASGLESFEGTFDNWFNEDAVQHAFYLTDVGSTAVPEPSSWAMMLLGFGVAGLALRRGRKPKPATA